jgi:hypothetical protein
MLQISSIFDHTLTKGIQGNNTQKETDLGGILVNLELHAGHQIEE